MAKRVTPQKPEDMESPEESTKLPPPPGTPLKHTIIVKNLRKEDVKWLFKLKK